MRVTMTKSTGTTLGASLGRAAFFLLLSQSVLAYSFSIPNDGATSTILHGGLLSSSSPWAPQHAKLPQIEARRKCNRLQERIMTMHASKMKEYEHSVTKTGIIGPWQENEHLLSTEKKNVYSRLFPLVTVALLLLLGNGTGTGMAGDNIPTADYNCHHSFTTTQVASAAVAPLADVGLREFLVKDGNQLLRLSLPTSLPTATAPSEIGDVGREVQEAVELVRLRLEQVGFSGKTPVWNAAYKEVNKAKSLISTPDMLKGIPTSMKGQAEGIVAETSEKLQRLGEVVRDQDITSTLKLQEECSELVYKLREMSMKQNVGELPFEIPSEFTNLPQLKGRAVVECTIRKANNGNFNVNGKKSPEATMTMMIDGYHAPITAGNFMDLVQRKFYDNMPIQSVGELIVQTGKPTTAASDSEDGFIDPKTKEKRVIPLEIFYKKDVAPTYGYTSDDDMRATESMALPFQAYGALGMAHDPEDPNTASSQIFFLKWNQDLVAPSRNTLDGSQACFGYVTNNQDILKEVEEGDSIVSMKVIQGGENLFVPGK